MFPAIMIQQFIDDAKSYCDAVGIKPSTLGQYAVADNTLFSRLESGGQCLPRTIERVRAYMAANPPSPARAISGQDTAKRDVAA